MREASDLFATLLHGNAGVAVLNQKELLTVTMLAFFTNYDIRGQLDVSLSENIACRIGRAYAQFLNAKRIVIGGDMHLSIEDLKQALANGLMDAGCDAINLGMMGTEEAYLAASHLDVDGGILVTASRNPFDFNSMKLVYRGAQPISTDTDLKGIQSLAEAGDFVPVCRRSSLLRYINPIESRFNLQRVVQQRIVIEGLITQ